MPPVLHQPNADLCCNKSDKVMEIQADADMTEGLQDQALTGWQRPLSFISHAEVGDENAPCISCWTAGLT